MTPLLEAFSAALLHFAWQGCLVLALLWVTLFVLRRRSANARYAAACLALALLAAAPALTTYVLYQRPAGPPRVATDSPLTEARGLVVQLASTRPTPALAIVQSWALPAWAFGVILFSLRMVWGCAQVAALRRNGGPAGDAVLSMVASLSRRMGLTGQVRVLISESAGGPSLVGWLRPVILLPAAALSGLTPEQLDAVLAHELAHIRRHDYLVNWMQMLVETLLFYHPAVWWISQRIRHERELCCDDLAVNTCAGALCYARALTTLEKMRISVPLTALGSTDGALLYRIQRVVGATTQEYGPSRASVVVALSLALAGLVFSVNRGRAQNRPAQDYMVRGDTLMRSGANDQALQKYLEGAAADPGNRATYQKRSIEVLMRMDRKPDAAEVNAQILKDHPDDTDALEFAAAMMLDQGNAAAAVAQLQQVLASVPDNPVAHLDLGRAYAAQGDAAAARTEIERAIALRPDFIRARQALERLGSPSAKPGNEDALAQSRSLGDAAVRAGNYDLAIYEYQRLLDRTDLASGVRGDIYLRIGDACLRKGDSGAAIQAMAKAHELSPGNRLVLGPLIVLLDAAGRHSEAAQLRAESESEQASRAAMTSQFLREELAAAERQMEALRGAPQPDVSAIQQAESQLAELQRKLAASVQVPQPAGRVLEAINFVGISEATRPQLQLPVHIGDTLTVDNVGATYSAAKILDESLDVRFTVLENGKARLVITKPSK
jgi:beta-lactamase regulating signal transducer with metallopeptidase domain/Flp pilus assembly protein TadD